MSTLHTTSLNYKCKTEKRAGTFIDVTNPILQKMSELKKKKNNCGCKLQLLIAILIFTTHEFSYDLAHANVNWWSGV